MCKQAFADSREREQRKIISERLIQYYKRFLLVLRRVCQNTNEDAHDRQIYVKFRSIFFCTCHNCKNFLHVCQDLSSLISATGAKVLFHFSPPRRVRQVQVNPFIKCRTTFPNFVSLPFLYFPSVASQMGIVPLLVLYLPYLELKTPVGS